MFVTIRIHAEPDVRIVCIPQAALKPGNKVGLVRDGKFKELQNVKTIAPWQESPSDESPAYWLIEADADTIRDSDQIVIEKPLGVSEGTPVNIATDDSDIDEASTVAAESATTANEEAPTQ